MLLHVRRVRAQVSKTAKVRTVLEHPCPWALRLPTSENLAAAAEADQR
jgi:hypothetical protein